MAKQFPRPFLKRVQESSKLKEEKGKGEYILS
jgi:hypothetical protein